MKQIQTTNKKTNEVFVLTGVNLENNKLKVVSLENGMEKEVAESTFKRWYTKPVEVEVAEEVAEETTTEEVVTEEVVEEVAEEVVTEVKEEEIKEEAEVVEEEAIQCHGYRVTETNELVADSTVQEIRAYLEDCLSITEMGDTPTEMIECKDNIVAVRFMGKTVAQIKGKRKLRVYLNGRHMTEETFAQCEHDKPEYTHNAFIKVDSVDDLDLVFKAVEEVKNWIRNSKAGK